MVGQVGSAINHSDPAIGTLRNPQLNLSFNAMSNANGGTLVISCSAEGFGPSNGTATSLIGATTPGTVSSAAYSGTNNTAQFEPAQS